MTVIPWMTLARSIPFHAIPPGAGPRHQLVIAFHHLHRRAQALAGGVHPHLARDLAVLLGQPDPLMSPQARAVMHLDRLPALRIDLAAAPAALDHEGRGRPGVERGHEIVGVAAERDIDAFLS